MNLAQALGAAAAASMMAMSASGIAPAQTLSEIASEARARLAPAVILDLAVDLRTARADRGGEPRPQLLAA